MGQADANDPPDAEQPRPPPSTATSLGFAAPASSPASGGWTGPASVPASVPLPTHSWFTQVFPSEQSAVELHPTHLLFATSHTGVVPRHADALAAVHSTHEPVCTRQAGVAGRPAQSASQVQPVQV